MPRTSQNAPRGSASRYLPGQYFDEETGLHYNYFRDYDPVTGRYEQSDPIGLVGGLNTYLYANANPLRYTDPNGLQAGAIALPGIGGGAAAAAEGAAGASAAGGLGALGPAAAVAGAGLAGYGLGSAIYDAFGIHIVDAIETVVEVCSVDDDVERCRKVKNQCIAKCSETALPTPDGLGHAFRRCVRECMEAQGCFNF